MVLAPDDEAPLVLHGAAASVWQLLDRPADLDDLLDRATATGTGTPTGDLGALVAEAVEVLAERSLIVAAPDVGGPP
jgi:ABC-type uncharacterized transport system permease subunit